MSVSIDYLHDQETRTTDGETGGQKGVKLCQIGALDPAAQIELGRVAGMGADKYAPFNYLRGFEWSKAYNAMQRHANLFWAGEDRDPESGRLHIVHAAWMALALASFILRGLGTDDRPPRLGSDEPAAITPEEVAAWLRDMGVQPVSPEDELGRLLFPDHADMSCDERR